MEKNTEVDMEGDLLAGFASLALFALALLSLVSIAAADSYGGGGGMQYGGRPGDGAGGGASQPGATDMAQAAAGDSGSQPIAQATPQAAAGDNGSQPGSLNEYPLADSTPGSAESEAQLELVGLNGGDAIVMGANESAPEAAVDGELEADTSGVLMHVESASDTARETAQLSESQGSGGTVNGETGTGSTESSGTEVAPGNGMTPPSQGSGGEVAPAAPAVPEVPPMQPSIFDQLIAWLGTVFGR